MTYEYDEANMEPPVDVREAVGLSPEDVQLLISMNDNGDSFNEIARYIEEDL